MMLLRKIRTFLPADTMIIELISSSKDEIVTKVTQIPTDTIISTSGPSI